MNEKELSVMLDQIEERAENAKITRGKEACDVVEDLLASVADNLLLVKALRRAIDGIDNEVGIAVATVLKTEITAILNGEEEKRDSGEPGAKMPTLGHGLAGDQGYQ